MDIFSYLCLFICVHIIIPFVTFREVFYIKNSHSYGKNVFHLFIVSIIIHCYNIMYMEICDLDIEHYDNIFYDNAKRRNNMIDYIFFRMIFLKYRCCDIYL